MAYNDNELSVRSGAPRELYRFEGTYVTYRYTSDTKPRTWQAPDENEPHTYLPITLERSEVTTGTPEDDNLDLTIDLPVSAAIVTAYAFNTSPPDLEVRIWRFHALDAVVPYWTGTITNINIEDGIASFTSPSEIARAMSQEFPNVYYQAPCNHVLYDARCKVDYGDWSGEVTITATGDKQVTVAAMPAELEGKLIGGEFVLPSGERRMIVGQAGTVLSLNFPFSAVNVGMVGTIAAGCDYAFNGDCKLKFANQLNFGGFPFIPEDNIFEQGAEPGSRLPDNTCKPFSEKPWKYMSGDNIAWASPEYDDSAWPYGQTPFGNNYGGSGGNVAATYIPGKDQGQPICWFRTWIGPYVNQFIITKDDSARVWCDGVEFTGGGIGDTLITPPPSDLPRLIAVRVDDDRGGGIVFSDALLGHGN